MQTRIGISDVVKLKTDDSIKNIKNESFENKLEAAKLASQMMKLQPAMEELKKKNTKLEQQLIEAKLKLDETRVNSTVYFITRHPRRCLKQKYGG
jgi:chromosome segregation ATPase